MNAHTQETAYQPEGPQPLMRQIAPGAAYPTQALGPLEAVAQAVQGQTLAPIAIAAQSALSVAALAVQGFADVETLGGTRPTSLYCLTIAKSGERKSACDAPLMSALKDFERTQGSARADAFESWKNAHALWDVQRKKILNDSKSPKQEKRTGAQTDLDALGPEPAAPPLPDRTVSEPTFAGLTLLYVNGRPSLGIFSDEGGQFLGGHAMMSDSRQMTLAALNDLWQGNPIKRTREGDGAYTLWGRRLSVHLMVQPGVARAFMADPQTSDTGFLARFLITEPPSAMGTRLQAKVARDPLALAAFSARLRAILETDLPIDEKNGALMPRTLALSPEARDLLCDFADTIEVETAPTARLATLTGTASKVAEQACRIAGVLTPLGGSQRPSDRGRSDGKRDRPGTVLPRRSPAPRRRRHGLCRDPEGRSPAHLAQDHLAHHRHPRKPLTRQDPAPRRGPTRAKRPARNVQGQGRPRHPCCSQLGHTAARRHRCRRLQPKNRLPDRGCRRCSLMPKPRWPNCVASRAPLLHPLHLLHAKPRTAPSVAM